MKNKKRIWKFIGAGLGLTAIACIIPISIISCGSSTSQSSNLSTNSAGVLDTSVGGNASQINFSQNQLGNNLNNVNSSLFSDWNVDAASKYTITVPQLNGVSCTWYQVPLQTVETIINSNSTSQTSPTNYFSLIIGNKNTEQLSEYSNSISFAADTNNTVYFCEGGNGYYSQLTVININMSNPSASNPLSLTNAYLKYQPATQNPNLADYTQVQNNGNGQLEIDCIQQDTLSFQLVISNPSTELTTVNFANDNYVVNWSVGNLSYSYSLSNSNAYTLSVPATDALNSPTVTVSVSIIGPTGVALNLSVPSSQTNKWSICLNDPLSINDSQYSLNNSQNNNSNITINKNQSITYSITDWDVNGQQLNDSTFSGFNYQVDWILYNSETGNSIFAPTSPTTLSNQNSWSCTFTNIPIGSYTVFAIIMGQNQTNNYYNGANPYNSSNYYDDANWSSFSWLDVTPSSYCYLTVKA